ncbi:cilia- and flagella-associated protein 45-like [Belonocnema kinseyi]|uniref:cilia- and flagella-associated protein 45-like n=1 Tax=Belonocnema kinseyi TaxID=2817044 RepID=UPI00143D76FB|nr:cilia- and flagella-associated protein 45-like [Belonocnema kinseyi]
MKISYSDLQIVTMKKLKYYQEQGKTASNDKNEIALLSLQFNNMSAVKHITERKSEIIKPDTKGSYTKIRRLTDTQAEAHKRAMHFLERAFNIKLEQEEEIQKCNRLILETKCQAVRHAQIAEKEIVKQELLKESQHFDDMMENERRLSIKEEAEKEKAKALQRQKFAEALKKQIFENEQNKLMETWKKQEESRLINLNEIAWQNDEILRLKSQQTKTVQVRKSLSEINNQLKHFKYIEREENRIMDMRVQEFQREKYERDDKIAEERKLKRLKKEQQKENAALKVQSALRIKVQTDEVNAARIQEDIEREWRRKQKEEALRAAKNETILRISREEQIKEKHIMQALEIKRGQEQFNKITAIHNDVQRRDEKEKDRKYKEAIHQRSEILKQVNKKECQRFFTRQNIIQHGLSMRKEEEMRRYKLREAMEQKCSEMRRNNVPQTYIFEVIRMIQNLK